MSADYSKLAEGFEASQIGYSSDLYAVLAENGLKTTGAILDVACGTGLASEPLAKAGAKITGIDASDEMLEYARARMPGQTWQTGDAANLEFSDNAFDAAICAQAFHWFDRPAAMREMIRVVKPGGVVAVWWKHLMSDDPVKLLRDRTAKELGKEPPAAGLQGGFVEFYSSPLLDHALRVVPWRFATTVEKLIASERASGSVAAAYGADAPEYFERLASALHAQYGGAEAVSVGYLQFVYTGKKP